MSLYYAAWNRTHDAFKGIARNVLESSACISDSLCHNVAQKEIKL